MAYNFATKGYHSFFKACRGFDSAGLRAATLRRVAEFKPELWHEQPIATVLKGKQVKSAEDKLVDTFDAFGAKNGKQLLSPKSTVDKVLQHLQSFQAADTDLRAPTRRIEEVFFNGDLAADLVAGQTLDFHKQDGITEIEESAQAMLVERLCNDALYEDEKAGRLSISRAPAFVGCVSNFTNFLDLCRKILRNVELGVPVVVLSRSNTTQHMYRYVLQLRELMEKEGMDPGLCTYVSCTVDEQRRLMAALPESPMYFTGSREVATKIKEVAPRIVSSTGGPNTMVVGPGLFTPEVAAAARKSSLIENKGQCTAMRHLVLPGGSEEEVKAAYTSAPSAIANGGVVECVRQNECAALLKDLEKPLPAGYGEVPLAAGGSVAMRFGKQPPAEISEQWREAFLDVTAPEKLDDAFLAELAAWLNREQPISLAFNCSLEKAQELFEETSLVIYTVGNVEQGAPALTAQARPQEGECFGEFPPRRELEAVTAFPVIVPSSTPGYYASYSEAYLRERAAEAAGDEAVKGLLELCSAEERGYCQVLLEYLADATTGPHRGKGVRTSLYGLQRPPLKTGKVCVRLEASAAAAEAMKYIVPFAATTAKAQLVISADPTAALPDKALAKAGVKVVRQSAGDFAKEEAGYWNVVSLPRDDVSVASTTQYPMAAHFISKLFPMGHIKSTLEDHEEFLTRFGASQKWLKMAGPKAKL